MAPTDEMVPSFSFFPSNSPDRIITLVLVKRNSNYFGVNVTNEPSDTTTVATEWRIISKV